MPCAMAGALAARRGVVTGGSAVGFQVEEVMEGIRGVVGSASSIVVVGDTAHKEPLLNDPPAVL